MEEALHSFVACVVVTALCGIEAMQLLWFDCYGFEDVCSFCGLIVLVLKMYRVSYEKVSCRALQEDFVLSPL